MWSSIPYSILADDDFTSGVAPIAGGSTSLPAKTAKWTTTRGKLTEDECNAAAKEFHSRKFDLRFYDDDVWVKNNPEDPKTTELAA
jgi:hypothetical protein